MRQKKIKRLIRFTNAFILCFVAGFSWGVHSPIPAVFFLAGLTYAGVYLSLRGAAKGNINIVNDMVN